MAIFASTSTITTQTVPLIIVDPATVTHDYFLMWDSNVGAFTAQPFQMPSNAIINFNANTIQGTLLSQNGGTGFNTYTKGDMLYADLVSGDLVLKKLAIGANTDILTISNGIPSWTSSASLTNTVQTKVIDITTTSTNIGTILPANTRIMRITVIIDNVYNGGATMSIGTTISPSELLTTSELFLTGAGIYNYSLEILYAIQTQLYVTITGASQGSGKIIVEFNTI